MLNDDEMLVGFLEEAREHLSTIEPDLLELEKNPHDMDTINRLFRSVHSIKGGAGFFGLDKMGTLSHAMENLMSLARTSKLIINQTHIDALLAGLDRLVQMVDDPANSDSLDIEHEIKIIGSYSKESGESIVEESETMVVSGESLDPEITYIKEFHICRKELEESIRSGMEVYAISVSLKDDILAKGKTPFQFISDLEELGHFIDSYLDLHNAATLENCCEGDLSFAFLFATIMEPDIALEGLELSKHQVSLIDIGTLKEELGKADYNEFTISPTGDSISAITDEAEAETVSEPEETVNDEATVETEKTDEAEPVLETKALVETKKDIQPKNPPGAIVADVSHGSNKAEESIRVSVNKLNKLVDLAGELVLVRNQILRTSEHAGTQITGLGGVLQNLNLVTTELQEEILNTRMQPVSVVFGKFPRLVRELGMQLGKKIELHTEGNDVELDKTVIESLSDPLSHIVRNTADHGIESPDDRKKAGKPEVGKLLLKAYHESGQVIIKVKDDGKGIKPNIVAEKALQKGVISEERLFRLSNKEKVNLVFAPGFSTAENVSSVSGRGVGMDVVKTSIEQIGGTVELDSVPGEGTSIQMTLPLTMAIVSCLIVQAGSERFAIPQVNLEELVMLKPTDFPTMLGKIQDRDVLRLRGNLLPLIYLTDGLGLSKNDQSRENSYSLSSTGSDINSDVYNKICGKRNNATQNTMRILVITVGASRVGIIVDSILGSEEIVVKPIPEFMKDLKSFSGATILGDGTIALILDTLGFVNKNELLHSERLLESQALVEDKIDQTESQSLLIFDNGTDEQFAIAVPLIQRVDEIDLGKIQNIGQKEYMEYRGHQMRILRMAEYLPVQKPDTDPGSPSIIIPKEARVPIGLLINRVIDTRTLKINMEEGSIRGKGILGSTLIDGKITLLLDLYAVLEMGEPDSVHRVGMKKEVFPKTRVLLVEDTPFFLTMVREYLKSVGFDVVTATNGLEGLDELRNNQIDIVLSDIEMPEMDGWGFIKQVRSNDEWRDLPVLAITSLNDDASISAGKKAGFNEWLIKLNKEEILDNLNKYIRNK